MGKAILCIGRDAAKPYTFEDRGIKIYTIEELCYVLKEDAYILDGSIVNKKLAAWIENECGLPELSGMLYPLISQKGSLSAFVGTILEYVHLYDSEMLLEIDILLKKSANLNVYEKYKTRVDLMVERGKYAYALVEYDELLGRLPEAEVRLRGLVHHNKAVALTGLFLFELAADNFQTAYELLQEKEILMEYLAARRMYLSDVEYIALAAEYTDSYELSLELEKRVEALREQWEEQLESKRLRQMQEWRTEGDTMKYYEEAERITHGLKAAYRMNISE